MVGNSSLAGIYVLVVRLYNDDEIVKIFLLKYKMCKSYYCYFYCFFIVITKKVINFFFKLLEFFPRDF